MSDPRDTPRHRLLDDLSDGAAGAAGAALPDAEDDEAFHLEDEVDREEPDDGS